MDIIKSIEHEQLKATIPDLKIGNTVKVHVSSIIQKLGVEDRTQVVVKAFKSFSKQILKHNEKDTPHDYEYLDYIVNDIDENIIIIGCCRQNNV